MTLGRFPYPRDRTPTIEEQHLAELLRKRPADEEISIPGLEATVELTESAVVAGQDGAGRVMLRNVGRTKVEFSSAQPLVGGVNDPISREAIGGYFGGIGPRSPMVSWRGTSHRAACLEGPKTRGGAVTVDVCSRDGGFRVKGMACQAQAIEPACCPRAECLAV